MKLILSSLFLSLALIGCSAPEANIDAAPIKAAPEAMAKKDLNDQIKKAVPHKAPQIAGQGCRLFGAANAIVTCPVKVAGNATAVAMQMDALFDASKMSFKGVSCLSGESDSCANEQKLSSGHSLKLNEAQKGHLKLLTFSATSLDPMATTNGTLFELSFTLSQDIPEAAAEKVNFAGLVFSSAEGKTMQAQLQNGVINLQ